MMSAPAVKPALPNAGAQAPKVGSGAPPATTNNPPSSATGGPKVLPTSGSPNRPIAPANANHAALGTMPLSLVQEHRGSSALNQQPTPQPPQSSALSRTPEKPKEIQAASTLGPKPTSNGVEGSPNRPASALQPSLETKKPEEASAAAIVNHSTDNAPVVVTAAAVMPASQPAQHNTSANVSHASPIKLQPQPPAVSATTGSTAANHSASSVAPSKPDAGKPGGSGVVATSLAGSTAAQAAEPPPPTVPATASGTTSASPPVQPLQTSQPAPPPLPPPPPPQQQQPPPPPPPPSPPSAPTQPPPPQPLPPQQQQQHQAPQVQSLSQQQQNQPPQPQETHSAQKQHQPPPPLPTPLPPPPQQQQPPQQPAQQQQQQQQPAPSPPPQQKQQQVSPTEESPAKTPVTTPETKTKVDAPPKPEFKVATPPRNSKRKREVKTPAETPKSGASEQDDRKSKRVRTRTQPYQSPLPELTYIAKLKNLMKNPDDKLIVFYKNEFLAVRNAEGSFYICQAMQNIYKSSPRIRIRWLSQEKKDNKPTDVYIPDFYDATDFDCILTNLELKKLDKNKYQLPEEERERTQSILKRALDVEKGVSEKPPVTEEHPDGLDLSLFRDESQLKKRKSLKRTPTKKGKENTSEVEDGWVTGEEESEEEPKRKRPKTPKKLEKPKVSTKEKVKTKEKAVDNKRAERTSERGRERALSSRRRSEPTTAATTTAAATAITTPTPVAAKNAAVKQPAAKQTSARQAAAKPAAVKSPAEKKPKVASKTPKKTEPAVDISIPTRSTKTRSVKAASQPKTSPVTRTKERDRRGETPAKGRKKPGKKA